MPDIIDRSNPGDLAAGTGLTFRTNLNTDRGIVYSHADDLEAEIEAGFHGIFGKGTIFGNTAGLTIDSPVAGRVYVEDGYTAIIGGVPVTTASVAGQDYTDTVLNHVFLVVGTDGALSLRVSTSATEAANELWIGDVDATGAPAVVDEPVGKAYINVALGTAADGTLVGSLDARYQVIADTGTADTEFIVAHGLARAPVGYLVCRIDKAGIVYASGTTWTTTNIYLKCNAANAALTLIVW